MSRSVTHFLVAALLVLPTARAWAGGLPMLCLPVTGASSDRADATTQRVAAALGKGVDRTSLRQNGGQWYLAFHFNRDHVRLAEIDAALKNGPVSVPRDRLRLFGDVILEIDIAEAATEKLLTDLASLKHASMAESKRERETLLVQLNLPAPVTEFRAPDEFGKVSFDDQTFQRATGSAVALGDLPTYEMLRKVVDKYDGKLIGLRWNCWGCRALGCVAGKDAKDRTAQAAAR
jgi:hypothetical protein